MKGSNDVRTDVNVLQWSGTETRKGLQVKLPVTVALILPTSQYDGKIFQNFEI
jgi:hypothetical protein